ncbi:MAG: TetR/AcrR family transcriptional regulator [Alphaproteobacteria bacterium]|nr:TetR/AcrR family transcriptional regulator [Alphaproteobacteria bacterium]
MAKPDGVESLVTDPDLVSKRRTQIVKAAVVLFAKQGYGRTSVMQIAKSAGVSIGLIYQYFGDKDDILFLALKLVLDTYERDIPKQFAGLDHPLDRLRAALRGYCTVVDDLREATVLAYRATRSLPFERRVLMEEAETRTNLIFKNLLEECVSGGYLVAPDLDLLTYQYVHFSHAWALKYWAYKDKYDLEAYVAQGCKLLIEPFLTDKGRAYYLTSPNWRHE